MKKYSRWLWQNIPYHHIFNTQFSFYLNNFTEDFIWSFSLMHLYVLALKIFFQKYIRSLKNLFLSNQFLNCFHNANVYDSFWNEFSPVAGSRWTEVVGAVLLLGWEQMQHTHVSHPPPQCPASEHPVQLFYSRGSPDCWLSIGASGISICFSISDPPKIEVRPPFYVHMLKSWGVTDQYPCIHFLNPVVMGEFELRSLLSHWSIEDLISFNIGHEMCVMFSDEAYTYILYI